MVDKASNIKKDYSHYTNINFVLIKGVIKEDVRNLQYYPKLSELVSTMKAQAQGGTLNMKRMRVLVEPFMGQKVIGYL